MKTSHCCAGVCIVTFFNVCSSSPTYSLWSRVFLEPADMVHSDSEAGNTCIYLECVAGNKNSWDLRAILEHGIASWCLLFFFLHWWSLLILNTAVFYVMRKKMVRVTSLIYLKFRLNSLLNVEGNKVSRRIKKGEKSKKE